jgi:hypothetical protein
VLEIWVSWILLQYSTKGSELAHLCSIVWFLRSMRNCIKLHTFLHSA